VTSCVIQLNIHIIQKVQARSVMCHVTFGVLMGKCAYMHLGVNVMPLGVTQPTFLVQ
jgi:hypothetical protein